ncbi:P-loop containing nucleoside triphosphate hydrolases superfamily [Synechococcus sp. A18-40]|nr:P-loop containing nucleoside triphosphate hydrolases superfamily [Synechococcus sp. A18-40]
MARPPEAMARVELVADWLVAAGFIRPSVLWRGPQRCRSSFSHWGVGLLIGLSGLLVEPLAWLQSLLYAKQLRRVQLPPLAERRLQELMKAS